MEIISYTDFRAEMKKVLDQVNDDHKPIIITRQGGKSAVLMSAEDFSAYEETAYLMASPKNAERLNRAIADIRAGVVSEHGLIENE